MQDGGERQHPVAKREAKHNLLAHSMPIFSLAKAAQATLKSLPSLT